LLGEVCDGSADEFGTGAEVKSLRPTRDLGDGGDPAGGRLGIPVGDQALDGRFEQCRARFGAALGLGAVLVPRFIYLRTCT
jgi:hypothetical protein